MNIKKEEYTSLGDFIKTSFIRDQALIMTRFPKLDTAFLQDFTTKLQEAKKLESGFVLTEEQKVATASLYAEAGALNNELNFLKRYVSNAGLDTGNVTTLKKDLTKGNIEGVILKTESLKQYITTHATILEAEGMAPNFANQLEAHKVSFSNKNEKQNNFMNSRMTLTAENKQHYKELYGFIVKISDAGKLVFDGTSKKKEYNITHTISRMRVVRIKENSTV